MIEAGDWMNDYRKIRVDPEYRRLRPTDTLAMHRRERRWLVNELGSPGEGPTVVVTHHAPSLRSVRGDHQRLPISGAYASNLEEVVAASGARVWIHGHTHHAVDYRLAETRVLSNPRGYAGEDEVPGFRPDLVVEI